MLGYAMNSCYSTDDEKKGKKAVAMWNIQLPEVNKNKQIYPHPSAIIEWIFYEVKKKKEKINDENEIVNKSVK